MSMTEFGTKIGKAQDEKLRGAAWKVRGFKIRGDDDREMGWHAITIAATVDNLWYRIWYMICVFNTDAPFLALFYLYKTFNMFCTIHTIFLIYRKQQHHRMVCCCSRNVLPYITYVILPAYMQLQFEFLLFLIAQLEIWLFLCGSTCFWISCFVLPYFSRVALPPHSTYLFKWCPYDLGLVGLIVPKEEAL